MTTDPRCRGRDRNRDRIGVNRNHAGYWTSLLFNADSDADSDPDPEDLSPLFVPRNGLDGSPERQSLSGSHGQRPWFQVDMMQSIAASLNRHCALSIAVLAAVLLSGAGPSARAQGSVPGEVGINEKLGAQVALDAVLKDEDGKDIALRQLIDKPTILTLNYFTCTGICSPLLNALVDALNGLALEPGKDFRVITVSFDPSDTPEVAHQKRINYLKQMNRPFSPADWRFLTGSAQATKAVTDSVGFNFKAAANGFVHPGAIIVLTPKGIVSRYLYGISFLPADIQMAVQEAASGHVRPSISRVLDFCYSYDTQGRRYVLNTTRVMGAAVLVFAAGFVVFLLKGGTRRNK